MTKKAEKAAAVAEAKRVAFVKKVRTLTGFLFGRLDNPSMNAAFETGMTADDYAASVAAKSPVGAAIHPMKVDAIARARQLSEKTVATVTADLAAHGWDSNACAPYPPRTMPYGSERDRVHSKYSLYGALTRAVNPNYRPGDVELCVMDGDAITRFIESNERDAALQYDMFICKLVTKVGEVTQAAISGNHVWGDSVLTVTKPGGKVERWHTQQIVNVSKLGKHFNQWPTRLMK